MRCAVLILMGAVVTSSASAKRSSDFRINRLIKALGDSDLRVRIQALAVLGKLKSRRAVPRLMRVLDEHGPSERVLAAKALAAIGDRRALSALRRRTNDANKWVRQEVSVAYKRLQALLRRTGAPRIMIRLAALGGKAKHARHIRHLMRKLWKDQMRKSSGGKIGIVDGQPSRKPGKLFELSSSITELKEQHRGSMVETTCHISVIVGDHNGSIKMMTSSGATVETPKSAFSRNKRDKVVATALESAIASAYQNVRSFFDRQGI